MSIRKSDLIKNIVELSLQLVHSILHNEVLNIYCNSLLFTFNRKKNYFFEKKEC